MKKFILKFLFISAIILIIYLVKNYDVLKDVKLKDVPGNNLGNSMSFKAKMDHLIRSSNYNNCEFLISGSSISLNNVAGKTIAERTGSCVYNISSWGFKVSQTNRFLEVVGTGKIKHLLVAFNNTDFRGLNYNIDYELVKSYIEGGSLTRSWLFITKFNLETFVTDWNRRSLLSHVSNEYRSINFDETGSCHFSRKNFVIDSTRWKRYDDTTGFVKFCSGVVALKRFCVERNVELTIVYLRNREDLLTEKRKKENKTVALKLKENFGDFFIDLHEIEMPLKEYCDGMHYFREGAERVTKIILDSLDAKKD